MFSCIQNCILINVELYHVNKIISIIISILFIKLTFNPINLNEISRTLNSLFYEIKPCFIFNLSNLIVCKLYLLHNKKREESTSKQVNIGTRASSSFTCSVKCRSFGVKTCAIIAYYIFLFIHLPSSSDSYRCRSFLRFISSFLASYFCNVCM